MRRLRSLMARMVFSHILVATLTSVIVVLLLIVAFALGIQKYSPSDYRGVAALSALSWLMGTPDGRPNEAGNPFTPPGFTLVVSPDQDILYSQGDTVCHVGKLLADCAPELLNREESERFYSKDGGQWVEVFLKLASGQRVIYQRKTAQAELSLFLPNAPIYGNGPFMLIVSSVMALLSFPVGLVLAWLSARPLARRLSNIAKVSKRFASGDLAARVQDQNRDEVGGLAQQFDDMADALAQNVGVLRELAQRNADLAQQAEQAAIQAERVRLSRDLHDDIAQRLFSLSVSSAALPDLIRRDQQAGVEQSAAIASLAEQTLLDLRALLIELRPSRVLQRGLSNALQELVNEWQAANQTRVDCSIMLAGGHIPASVEDALYRITQEALNNIAKHAHATSVQVSLLEGRRQITLSVTDNGQGFDPTQIANQGKFGLISMRERAQVLGGTLAIESDTTRGTTLRITLPLQREAEKEKTQSAS